MCTWSYKDFVFALSLMLRLKELSKVRCQSFVGYLLIHMVRLLLIRPFESVYKNNDTGMDGTRWLGSRYYHILFRMSCNRSIYLPRAANFVTCIETCDTMTKMSLRNQISLSYMMPSIRCFYLHSIFWLYPVTGIDIDTHNGNVMSFIQGRCH